MRIADPGDWQKRPLWRDNMLSAQVGLAILLRLTEQRSEGGLRCYYTSLGFLQAFLLRPTESSVADERCAFLSCLSGTSGDWCPLPFCTLTRRLPSSQVKLSLARIVHSQDPERLLIGRTFVNFWPHAGMPRRINLHTERDKSPTKEEGTRPQRRRRGSGLPRKTVQKLKGRRDTGDGRVCAAQPSIHSARTGAHVLRTSWTLVVRNSTTWLRYTHHVSHIVINEQQRACP